MMDKETINELKNKLIERKDSIEKELKKFTEKNLEIKGDFKTVFPKYGNDEDENAQEVTAYETSLGIEHRLELDLAEINKALERIKKGTYGICENCGKEIEIERLKAFPEATTCLNCKKSK